MNYKLVYTKAAQKDAKKIKDAGLKDKCVNLLELIAENPYQNPPPFEKLRGNLKGSISRRINIKHRLVYEVYESKKTIKVIRMWTHYE